MKIRILGAELSHEDGWADRQTDRQTDRRTIMTKLTAAFRNFGKVAKRTGRKLHNVKELHNVHF
jgi:hypothetical protein